MSTVPTPISGDALPKIFASAFEYLVDTGQRSVLFLDVMRRRGMQYREHLAETAPHLLDYEIELLLDGRTLQRPVNYGLVRITPPAGVTIDPKRRPFVVVDPRAGHARTAGVERSPGDLCRRLFRLQDIAVRGNAGCRDAGARCFRIHRGDW